MTPVLKTERLTLRGWKIEDFDTYVAFWADPDRTRHFLSGTLEKPIAWTLFCAMFGEWKLRNMGSFAIEADDGHLVGYSGLWYPIDIDEPELAWSLFAGNEGKGYATEAARAVQTWAASELGLTQLMSFVHPDNKASIAVARRLGATVEKETTLRGHPRLVFRHINPNNQT